MIAGVVVVLLLAMPLTIAEASALGKAAARGAAKSVSSSANKKLAQKLSQDMVRDRKTPVRVLNRDTRVFRYTHNSVRELKAGLRPGAHTTTKATPGRPMKAVDAQRKYGLPAKPTDRLTVSLPKGTPVKRNKALGGKPGVPEFNLPKGAPARTIQRDVRLR